MAVDICISRAFKSLLPAESMKAWAGRITAAKNARLRGCLNTNNGVERNDCRTHKVAKGRPKSPQKGEQRIEGAVGAT